MKVLITNKKLGFGDDAVLYNAEEYSKVFGGYVGHLENGVKVVIGTEDGAIIVEDLDVKMDTESH